MFARRLFALTAAGACLVSLLGCGSFVRLGSAEPAQAAKPLTYVALGASDSVGVGADKPETDGWVPQLAQLLPPGTRLLNLGVSGSLLSDALRQQLPVAVASDPDLVTVWLAVNDFNAQVPLARYQADLDSLLGQLATTRARVYVANVPDLTQVPIYEVMGIDKPTLAARVDAWNAAIAETAAKYGVTVVDLHSSWRELADHPEYVARDGFHPSADGYRRLAELFWSYIQPQLAQAA